MTEETVRPEDLKPGDRVELTLRGTVLECGKDLRLLGDECDSEMPLTLLKQELAHATITRLPPPVDPDLLLARKVVAALNRKWDCPVYASAVEAGDRDEDTEVAIALAAIKAAKEQG